MSAWLSTCVAVQRNDEFGASVAGCVGVQDSAPMDGSLMATPVSVWLPSFVAVSVKPIVSPASARPGGATTVLSSAAVLSNDIAGDRTAVTVAESGAED